MSPAVGVLVLGSLRVGSGGKPIHSKFVSTWQDRAEGCTLAFCSLFVGKIIDVTFFFPLLVNWVVIVERLFNFPFLQ